MKYIVKILLILFLTTAFNPQAIHAGCIPTAASPSIPVVYFGDLTNFDDVMALFLVLKDERIDLLAVYIVGDGFGDAGGTVQAVYNMLDWMGRTNVPVVIGSAYSSLDFNTPLSGPNDETWGAAVPKASNGKFLMDSLWGLQNLLPQSPRHYIPPAHAGLTSNGFEDDIAAINLIRSVIENSLTPVHILSFGPLTGPRNVLLETTFPCFQAPVDPQTCTTIPEAPIEVYGNIASFLQMGGDFNFSGSTTGNVLFFFPEICRSEFNIFLDPLAAQDVFDFLSLHDIPITIVPLDATNTVEAAPFIQDVNDTPTQTPEFAFIKKLMNEVARNWFSSELGLFSLYIWDAAAVLVFLLQPDPSIVVTDSETNDVIVENNTTLTKLVEGDDCITPGCTAAGFDACTITITRTYQTNTGQTNIGGSNEMLIIKAFDPDAVSEQIITRLNTPNANSARVPLKQPLGFYQYGTFVG